MIPMLCLVPGCDRKPGSRAARGRPGCVRSHGDLCLIARIPGDAVDGELGFRFAAPRDVDGDGIADVAAGARFTRAKDEPDNQIGTASIWSGASWRRLQRWEGVVLDGLFGHAVTLTPDLDGDGLADMLVAAPTGRFAQGIPPRGVLWARCPRTGAVLWSRTGEIGDSFGWDLAVTDDHNQDGVADLFVGAPGGESPKLHLLSGRDGAILRTYPSSGRSDSFGWYVSSIADMDGDSRGDVVVGVPLWRDGEREGVGAAMVLSSTTGKVIREWRGHTEMSQFGEMVLGLPDINGDRVPEVAVGAPHTQTDQGAAEGEVFVYSGATGDVVHHFRGKQTHELYGRMISRAGDYDRDGVEDIAIGAPWHAVKGMSKAGRMEIRSGRTGTVLVEVTGDAPERWYGWHMAAASNLGPAREPGLVVSLVRSRESDRIGAGALEIFAYRHTAARSSGDNAERKNQ